MDGWTLHWLEASGYLSGYRAEITDAFEQAYRTVSTMMPPPRLDVIVQRLAGETIPEMGLVGRAYRSTMFSMTVDMDNPNFIRSLSDGALHRQIVHEVHHCMRMAGPGYGYSLGEALVSEGLAGQFVRHLMGTQPEPWECAVTPQVLQAALPGAEELASFHYDHSGWFFGTGALPRRLGYSLGYQIAGRWLARAGEVDAALWVNVPAETVLAVGLERGTQDS
jgi:hypothetical protein